MTSQSPQDNELIIQRLLERERIKREVKRRADIEELGISDASSVYFEGSLEDVLEQFKDKPHWLVDGLIPASGVVLLHGRFSLGKSPFCWHLCQCISENMDFFGHSIDGAGSILWIEVDEPLLVSRERLEKLDPLPTRLFIVGSQPFNIVKPLPDDIKRLADTYSKVNPKLVIVNTLRNTHNLDDKDSATPVAVYAAFRRLFPDSVILFVHHDRKQARDPEGNLIPDGAEAFSGSQAWKNHATIALHMTSTGKSQVQVEVDKSQVGPTGESLTLKLADDGVTWLDTGAVMVKEAFSKLDPSLSKMERYEIIAKGCGVSVRTVTRRLRNAEIGLVKAPKGLSKTAKAVESTG